MKVSDFALFAGAASVLVAAAFALFTLIVSFSVAPPV